MKISKFTLIHQGFLAVILSSPALAAEILPMHYAEGFAGSIDSGESRVLPGAKVEIIDGKATAIPVPVLYIAPSKSRVAASQFQVNQAANCSVIKNELQVEATASTLASDAVKMVAEDFTLIKELNVDKDKAIKECLAARKTRQPDATEICAYKDELLETIKDLNETTAPVTASVQAILDSASKRINDFGSEIGGYAGADIRLFDKAEIDQVKQLNPGKEVRVVPMSKITFSFNPGEEALQGEIGRRTTIGYYLKGESMSAATPSGSLAAVTKIASCEATSLGILLSRLGACEPRLVRTGSFDYWYDGFGLLEGEVSYNKWVVYTKLEENKTKNGFFTTKTVKKVKEDLKNTETFKVAVVGKQQQGGENSGDYDVTQMAERLNDRLEKKMLRMMADKTDGVPSADALQSPGQNGADVAGDALLKCPDVYCQIGGYALKTLSAIFGGQISRAEAQKQWDYLAKEVWSQTTVTPYLNTSNAVVEWK